MDNKKYYYLKLKDNFFDRPEIKAIESIPNGYEYICIMQKMYLRSLERDGKLMLTDTIPYEIQTLSAVLSHRIEVIKSAVEIFRQFGLLDVLDDKTIYMTEIQNFIGRSSSEGDRKREYRREIEQNKQLLLGGGGQMSDERPPELKKELKLELDSDFDKFWNIYDKKKGKPNALRLWKKLTQSEKESIFVNLPLYVKATPDSTFRKDPERYLRHRVWEDELVAYKPSTAQKISLGDLTTYEEILKFTDGQSAQFRKSIFDKYEGIGNGKFRLKTS